MKVIICVLATDNHDYNLLYKGIKDTWGNINIENIKIIYLYGKPGVESYIISDKLYVDVVENIENMGHKVIKGFDYINKNYDFDYMLKTNLSSYIIQDKLLDYLKDKPPTKFLNAVLIDDKFPSGAGCIMSRDVLKTILDIQNLWDHNLLEDIALGTLISKNTDIKLTSAERIDYQDSLDIPEYIDPKVYHFRCKTFRGDRNHDIEIFKKLHSIYYDSSNNRTIINEKYICTSSNDSASRNKKINSTILFVVLLVLIIIVIVISYFLLYK